MHGLSLAVVGGALGPLARGGDVLGQAGLAGLVELGQIELGGAVAEVGVLPEIADGRVVVGLDALDGAGVETGQVLGGAGRACSARMDQLRGQGHRRLWRGDLGRRNERLRRPIPGVVARAIHRLGAVEGQAGGGDPERSGRRRDHHADLELALPLGRLAAAARKQAPLAALRLALGGRPRRRPGLLDQLAGGELGGGLEGVGAGRGRGGEIVVMVLRLRLQKVFGLQGFGRIGGARIGVEGAEHGGRVELAGVEGRVLGLGRQGLHRRDEAGRSAAAAGEDRVLRLGLERARRQVRRGEHRPEVGRRRGRRRGRGGHLLGEPAL